MKDGFVECGELAGKTIHTLRVFKDTGEGNELQIELTDGTSFNLCFAAKTQIEASVDSRWNRDSRDSPQLRLRLS